MKPDWDKLTKHFEGSNVLIADVDCTTEQGKLICDAQGVKSFPTLRSFNESGGIDYEGGRDLKSFKKFVKKTLKGVERSCDVKTKSDCTPEEAAFVEKWEAKAAAEIDAETTKLTKKLEGSTPLKTDARTQIEFEKKLLKLIAKANKAPKAEL